MNTESAKGSKWPAELLHYAWGFVRSNVCTPRFLQGQTEFKSTEVSVAAWFFLPKKVAFEDGNAYFPVNANWTVVKTLL